MTKQYNILVLTDHTKHSDQNSIYALIQEMRNHPQCLRMHIASRGLQENYAFFDAMQRDGLLGVEVSKEFKYTEDGYYFQHGLKKLKVKDYDLIFMRLPRPISDEFLLWIDEVFAGVCIVNNPRGIINTSTKEFLLNFPELCPDMRLCTSIDDVYDEASKYPIVLKPLREYGGKGLLKIYEGKVDDGKEIYDADTYLEELKDTISDHHYLSMRFLKNVSQGDKRILVAGGEIMAASLRMPAEDSWLCNVAQGGTSVATGVTEDEKIIVEKIRSKLKRQGILMYGVDTLVDDDGKRVLSEINTLSIGGWPQAQEQTGQPVIKKAIDKIFEYADEGIR